MDEYDDLPLHVVIVVACVCSFVVLLLFIVLIVLCYHRRLAIKKLENLQKISCKASNEIRELSSVNALKQLKKPDNKQIIPSSRLTRNETKACVTNNNAAVFKTLASGSSYPVYYNRSASAAPCDDRRGNSHPADNTMMRGTVDNEKNSHYELAMKKKKRNTAQEKITPFILDSSTDRQRKFPFSRSTEKGNTPIVHQALRLKSKQTIHEVVV